LSIHTPVMSLLNNTLSPQADAIISLIQASLQDILGEKLLGLYLYGSLAAGDFLEDISDIDLFALLSSELDQGEFDRLEKTHLDIVAAQPNWENRIEIAYLPQAALNSFRTVTSRIAIISPGEPFHFKEAGMDWAINWYILQRQGRVLFGPPVEDVFPEITPQEFISIVRRQAEEWRSYIVNARESTRYQAYAVVTICRAYYAAATGEQPTKPQAGTWAKALFPDWADLIDWSFDMRVIPDDHVPDPARSYPKVVAFVNFILERMAELPYKS